MGIGQREVLWNATEGVGNVDLNNMQHFLRAFGADWLMAQAGSFQGFGSVGAANYDRSKALYSYGDSCAPFPSTTALTVDTLGGPLIQWKTGPTFPLANNALPANWGLDPYALFYWFSPNELQTTHPSGDPTNPRWDLVCVKLSDVSDDVADRETRLQRSVQDGKLVVSENTFVKKRKVAFEKQLLIGTPDPSPVMPTLLPGFLPLYAVLVPAAASGTFTVDDNFHDYRMPLGSFHVDVVAADMISRQTSPTTGFGGAVYIPRAGFMGGVSFNSTANVEFVPSIPVPGHSCRLVGVSSLSGFNTSTMAVTLARYNPLNNGTYNQMGGNATWTLANLGSGASNPPTNSDYKWYTQQLATGAGNNPPAVAVKPPWGTGWPSGYASRSDRTTAINTTDTIGVRAVCTANSIIIKVRLHFAGMPV